MAHERILPGKRDGDGWIFQERIICDECKATIGEQQEYSGDRTLEKHRHGEYPGYRCSGCTSVAHRAYDSWVEHGRFGSDDDDD